MPALRSLICGLFVFGLISFANAADKVAPTEKRFILPSGESLMVKWTVGWAVIAPPPGVPEGSAAFSGPDASKMRVLLMPAPPGERVSADAESLRALSRNVARELEKSGKIEEQPPIEGTGVRGFYVKGIDRAPKPGEFKFIYSGAVAVGTQPFVFQILWNAGGETHAEGALAALKTMRIVK